MSQQEQPQTPQTPEPRAVRSRLAGRPAAADSAAQRTLPKAADAGDRPTEVISSTGAPAATAAPGAPMGEADRHGFINAFIGGVRPGGEQARSGRRLVAIGAAVAVVAGLSARGVGAFSAGGKSTAAVAAGHSPAATATGSAPSVTPDSTGHPLTVLTTVTAAALGTSAGSIQPAGQPVTTPAGSTGQTTTGSGPTGGAAPAATTRKPAAQVAAASTKAKAPATWAAIAGPGCPDSTAHHFYTKSAYFDQGNDGWLSLASGGYTGSGCNGAYFSEPMSGDAGSYDASQGVIWRWDFSGSFTHATCAFSMFVPSTRNVIDVGGDPTHYFFWGENYAYGMNETPNGSFTVNQVDNRGSWVSTGSFGVSTGIVTLKMVNTGIDYTSSTNQAHDAAAQVQLSCTAA